MQGRENMEELLREYIPIVVFIGIALVIGLALLIAPFRLPTRTRIRKSCPPTSAVSTLLTMRA
jgi:NADH:ubiquinone oxidoreductase subunit 3 (subunit A)